MTLFNAIALLQNQDFDDNFGGPAEDYGYHHGFSLFDPYVLGSLVVLGVILGLLMTAAWYIGRQRALRSLQDDRKASADNIYKSVKYLLDKALKSSGGMMLERGREVADMLESRLGFVLALDGKPAKMVKEVRDALKGDKPKAVTTPPVPRIKVALATEAHYVGVWNTLQDLSVFWSNEAEVKRMIEAAQLELSTRPPRLVQDSAREPWPWQRDKGGAKPAATAGIVAAALADADAAGSAPVVPPAPVVSDEPPPPPPAPKGGKKPLPAHKRNMLA